MIIGLAGKKRCGKDTIALYLEENYGYRRESFAAPIREFVASLCGYTMDELEAKKEVLNQTFDTTPRVMMQTLGTEWGRDMISSTIWLDRLEWSLRQNPNADVVVSDLRFDNEADMIRGMGGVIIHIERPGNTILDEHESERGIHVLEAEDYYLPNTDTLGSLYREVTELMKDLRRT
ncbi:MAG: hypothetical protein JRD89_19770 [Deltaproteobacteria bacterium]|nr:hypothetical protein [Deltaproteobacteria bacterium]